MQINLEEKAFVFLLFSRGSLSKVQRDLLSPCLVLILYVQFSLPIIEGRAPWAGFFVSSALITVES